MKILLLILFPFFSFAQTEVKFNELPEPIRKQVDSLTFQDAYYHDSLFAVDCGNKKRWIETSYKHNGEIFCQHKYSNRPSVIGMVGFIGIATYMSLLFFGFTQ